MANRHAGPILQGTANNPAGFFYRRGNVGNRLGAELEGDIHLVAQANDARAGENDQRNLFRLLLHQLRQALDADNGTSPDHQGQSYDSATVRHELTQEDQGRNQYHGEAHQGHHGLENRVGDRECCPKLAEGTAERAWIDPKREHEARPHLRAGESLLAKGRWEEAVAEFEAARVLAPHDKTIAGRIAAVQQAKREEEERKRKAAEEVERQIRLAEEDRKRKAAEETERQRRLDEEEKKRRADEEAEGLRRLAKEELKRKAAEEAERLRQVAEEEERKGKTADEAERQKRLVGEEEQQRKLAEEAERLRQLSEEEERKRKAVEERERQTRLAEEEQKRKAAEEADRERLATREAKRRRQPIAPVRPIAAPRLRLRRLALTGAVSLLLGGVGLAYAIINGGTGFNRPEPTAPVVAGVVEATETATATLPPPTATLTPMPALTPTPSPAPPAGATLTSAVDDAVMVFVPAGPFEMGSENRGSNEWPVHTVTLADYWIDRTEVTNAMYARCVSAGAGQPPNAPNSFSRSRSYCSLEPKTGPDFSEPIAPCQFDPPARAQATATAAFCAFFETTGHFGRGWG